MKRIAGFFQTRVSKTLLFGAWMAGWLGLARGDVFTFDWYLLTGDYTSSPVYLDLDGDPVPKKVWGASGEVSGVAPGDFPLMTTWLAVNYGSQQGYSDVVVEFEFGTDDTGDPHVFELDGASFSNDPSQGTARMRYVPAGGVPSVPVMYYAGGIDSMGNVTRQIVASGYVTEIRLEMNPGLGWAGYGNFFFDAEVAALGPVTGTQAPLFDEIAILIKGDPPYRTPITITGLDFDSEGQSEWQLQHPTGQVPDATVLSAIGGGYAGEPSGVTQSVGDLILPSNGRLVDRDGVFHFDPNDLDDLGRWFDPPMVSEYSYATRDGSFFSAVGLPLGLDTVDGKFTLWFDGTSRVVDEGVFFSFRDYYAGGGGLVRSFRITDIEPTVDAADPRAFPIRLAFWNGTETVRSASFSIRPAVVYQPDMRIGKSPRPASSKGNDVYNRSGAGQSLRLVMSGTRGAVAFLRMENDGESADRLRLRGAGSDRRFEVTYLSDGNRTSQVARGRFRTRVLEPKASQLVKIRLRPLAGRAFRKLSLLSTSTCAPGSADLARIFLSAR